MVTNTAFVFVKPHAVTPETLKLVSKTLAENGLRVTREGERSTPINWWINTTTPSRPRRR
jgi:hypothetical protein